jgi:hypothetical protein
MYTEKTKSLVPLVFEFPEQLSTEYIHPVDWPPTVRIVSESFVCTEAGTETARAGKTEMKTVNGYTFCKTTESEGVAGSIYTQYAYSFNSGRANSRGEKQETTIVTFSLRSVQCANYDEPKRTACETERATFDIDALIINSIKNS